MAFIEEDFYSILSDGLYFGSAKEAAATDNERFIRILSHGLLSEAFDVAVEAFSVLLQVGKAGIRMARGLLKVGS